MERRETQAARQAYTGRRRRSRRRNGERRERDGLTCAPTGEKIFAESERAPTPSTLGADAK